MLSKYLIDKNSSLTIYHVSNTLKNMKNNYCTVHKTIPFCKPRLKKNKTGLPCCSCFFFGTQNKGEICNERHIKQGIYKFSLLFHRLYNFKLSRGN